MTREEAIEVIKAKADYLESDKRFRAAVETIIPELAESEDERTRKALIETVKCIYAGDTMFLSEQQRDRYLDWLEKQQESLHIPETSKENANSFTDEDERIIRMIESFLSAYGADYFINEEWREIENWLEKQKDLTTENIYKHSRERMSFWNGQQKEQKPAEWSEEDRNTLLMAATVLKANFDSDEKFKDWDYDCETLAGKLLEMRYRISPSWKPSDEQLRPLEYAIDYFKKKRNDTTYLESLYNDLKKL